MVESVDPGKLGIMLFDGAETVGVGTLVTRSGKRAGILWVMVSWAVSSTAGRAH